MNEWIEDAKEFKGKDLSNYIENLKHDKELCAGMEFIGEIDEAINSLEERLNNENSNQR